MKEALEYIAHELDRRYRAGEERVFVSDANWDRLQKLKPSGNAARKATVATPSVAPKAARVSSDAVAEMLSPSATAPQSAANESAATKTAAKAPTFPPPPVLEMPSGTAPERLAWLREQLLNCTESRSHVAPGNQLVFGVGNPEADLFFVGEAPGADEAVRGEPFVGKAGELLNKMIMAMGLKRESVYIANILTWRPEHNQPTGNRPPTLEEMEFCLPYLKAQIEVVAPKVLVALGNTAVTGLLGPDPKRRLTSIRGQWHEFAGLPLMISFHPAYLLRNGTARTKRSAWEDMLAVMERLELPISDKQRGYFLPKG
jgi:uracil-DNA glycosylase family 4